jgi:hypothetical protein
MHEQSPRRFLISLMKASAVLGAGLLCLYLCRPKPPQQVPGPEAEVFIVVGMFCLFSGAVWLCWLVLRALVAAVVQCFRGTTSANPLVFEYRFTTLRWGSACFVLVGGGLLTAAVNALVDPPARVAAKIPPPPAWLPAEFRAGQLTVRLLEDAAGNQAAWLVPLVVGGPTLAIGLFLGWFARRWSTRYELDTTGITWHEGGRLVSRFRYGEILNILVDADERMLVVSGFPPRLHIKIDLVDDDNLETFRAFLAQLKQRVPWEFVVRNRLDDPVSPPVPGAQPKGQQFPRTGKPTLPLIYTFHRRGYALVIGAVVSAAVSAAVWLYATLPVPLAQIRREDDFSNLIILARVGAPLMLLVCCCCSWTIWIEFRVDGHGLDFHCLLRSRRYQWQDLTSVQVQFRQWQVGQHHLEYKNILVIRPHKGSPIMLDLQDRTSLFGDAIAAAAAQAGFQL